MAAFGIGRVGLGAMGAAAAVVLVAGCASSSHSSSAAGTLTTKSTAIGMVLVDASGHTVYELVGDSASHQTCTGECLATWPAVMSNGTQTVVNGHPAFTFSGDKSAGQTNGQNVTDQWGQWLALDASGNPIPAAGGTTSPAPTTKASAPGGGGPAF
jgi:predicted lipoprotein with Yx(FWY)xxD motif